MLGNDVLCCLGNQSRLDKTEGGSSQTWFVKPLPAALRLWRADWKGPLSDLA